jgi:hypothetical protein
MNETEDRDVQETMAAFEAAVSAEHIDLTYPGIERILLALDGSNQDGTTEELALLLARRHQAALHLVYGYGGAAEAAKDGYLRDRITALQETGLDVQPADTGDAGAPWEKILSASRNHQSDLVVVDAPYLEDFVELGTASIGTNLDILVHRSTTPLLIARAPRSTEAAGHLFRRLVLPAARTAAENAAAASWAFQLVEEGGTLDVLLIAETANLEAVAHLLADVDIGNLDEETLLALENKEQAGLIAAIQRRAAHTDIRCKVHTHTGEVLGAVNTFTAGHACIAVLGRPERRDSEDFQKIVALIRASMNPVLVI